MAKSKIDDEGIATLLDVFGKVLDEAAAAAHARDVERLMLRMDEATDLAMLIAGGLERLTLLPKLKHV